MTVASVGVAAVGLAGIVVSTTGEPSAGAAPNVHRHERALVRPAAHVPLDAAVAARARIQAEQVLRDAQVQQYWAAMAAYYTPKTRVNWDGIAQCETAGNWSMRGATFSGGLGFYNGTWSSFGGRQFAPNAGMATREQQIVVAERVYARYGLSGWGCRRYG
ncbi:MAG: transglycosylase family protein [Acidimicrobiia bacterium]